MLKRYLRLDVCNYFHIVSKYRAKSCSFEFFSQQFEQQTLELVYTPKSWLRLFLFCTEILRTSKNNRPSTLLHIWLKAFKPPSTCAELIFLVTSFNILQSITHINMYMHTLWYSGLLLPLTRFHTILISFLFNYIFIIRIFHTTCSFERLFVCCNTFAPLYLFMCEFMKYVCIFFHLHNCVLHHLWLVICYNGNVKYAIVYEIYKHTLANTYKYTYSFKYVCVCGGGLQLLQMQWKIA